MTKEQCLCGHGPLMHWRDDGITPTGRCDAQNCGCYKYRTSVAEQASGHSRVAPLPAEVPSSKEVSARESREKELTYVVSALAAALDLDDDEQRDALCDLRAWAKNRLKAQLPVETNEVPTCKIAGDAEARFMLWLMKEMPAGTVIGAPTWWSPRIFSAVQRAMEIQREVRPEEPFGKHPGASDEA